MKQPELYHRCYTTVSPARTRPSYKESCTLRSRVLTPTERRPTVEELEAAVAPGLSFIPDPALLPRPRKGRHFLHGPLDWDDICLVASVSHVTLAVWLLILHRRKLAGERVVTLPSRDLARLRIDRTAKMR